MTTNVPSPTFTFTGFVIPPESAVLAGVQSDINAAFGGNLNFTTSAGQATNATPQGQLANSFASIIGNTNDLFLFYTNAVDPKYATGRMQDAIGRIYFMERLPAIATQLQVLCIGLQNTIIPAGSFVQDPAGNLYTNPALGVIGVNGSVTIQFNSVVVGAIPVPNIVTIYQSQPGWDSATLVSGVQGQNTESTAAFETRRGLSTAANSLGSLPSILGAVLGVPGVSSAYCFENTNSFAMTQGGVTLAANSVYVAVVGGSVGAVAQAIWSRKAPGCAYGAGNTTVTIFDTSPGNVPPFPDYQVTFQIANPLPLIFSVNMVNSAQVPANATALIQNAIINAGSGNPNAQAIVDGPQVTIGAKVWASRFVPSIASLGTWAEGQIITINIGSNNNPDAAQAFGSCTGTTLGITALVSGSISVGQTLSISNGSGTILPGTTILAQLTGTVGGSGTYQISLPQTISGLAAGGTTLIGFATADQNSIQANINQIPTIAAGNISVTYT